MSPGQGNYMSVDTEATLTEARRRCKADTAVDGG